MRRAFVILLVFMLVISLVGCAANQQKEAKIVAPSDTAPAAENAPSKAAASSFIKQKKVKNGVTILTFAGQVRSTTQSKFKDSLAEVVTTYGGGKVILDMDGLAYMNEDGLKILTSVVRSLPPLSNLARVSESVGGG